MATIFILVQALLSLAFFVSVHYTLGLLVESDVFTAELFGCNSQFTKLTTKRKRIVIHDLFMGLAVLVFSATCFMQHSMIMISLVETVSLVKLADDFANREYSFRSCANCIAFAVAVVFSEQPETTFSKLCTFHCIFLYALFTALVSLPRLLTALVALGFKCENNSLFLVAFCFDFSRVYERHIWQMNRLSQCTVLVLLIFNDEATVFTFLYILSLPLLIL